MAGSRFNRLAFLGIVGMIAAVTLAACNNTPRTPSNVTEQRLQEGNQQRLLANQPPVTISWSAERDNLNRRMERINDQNMEGWIYLVSHGTVLAFYPVDGKVSSLNSYLTAAEQIVDADQGRLTGFNPILVEMPDLDGAYGKNSDGIFFFTTDGVYVEWFGEYLWSDQPLALAVQPLLVREIPADPAPVRVDPPAPAPAAAQ